MEEMHTVYLLTGSNLGRRELMLSEALRLIRKNVGRIEKRSLVYETAPWGFEDHRPFLNQALKVQTSLSPGKLLSEVLQIELVLGRIREADQYVSRVIDIDILFYDARIIGEKHLTIPHPLLHQRRFVLVPLAEIAPSFIHPVFNVPVIQLLHSCADQNAVASFEVEPVYKLTPKSRNDQ